MGARSGTIKVASILIALLLLQTLTVQVFAQQISETRGTSRTRIDLSQVKIVPRQARNIQEVIANPPPQGRVETRGGITTPVGEIYLWYIPGTNWQMLDIPANLQTWGYGEGYWNKGAGAFTATLNSRLPYTKPVNIPLSEATGPLSTFEGSPFYYWNYFKQLEENLQERAQSGPASLTVMNNTMPSARATLTRHEWLHHKFEIDPEFYRTAVNYWNGLDNDAEGRQIKQILKSNPRLAKAFEGIPDISSTGLGVEFVVQMLEGGTDPSQRALSFINTLPPNLQNRINKDIRRVFGKFFNDREGTFSSEQTPVRVPSTPPRAPAHQHSDRPIEPPKPTEPVILTPIEPPKPEEPAPEVPKEPSFILPAEPEIGTCNSIIDCLSSLNKFIAFQIFNSLPKEQERQTNEIIQSAEQAGKEKEFSFTDSSSRIFNVKVSQPKKIGEASSYSPKQDEIRIWAFPNNTFFIDGHASNPNIRKIFTASQVGNTSAGETYVDDRPSNFFMWRTRELVQNSPEIARLVEQAGILEGKESWVLFFINRQHAKANNPSHLQTAERHEYIHGKLNSNKEFEDKIKSILFSEGRFSKQDTENYFRLLGKDQAKPANLSELQELPQEEGNKYKNAVISRWGDLGQEVAIHEFAARTFGSFDFLLPQIPKMEETAKQLPNEFRNDPLFAELYEKPFQ